MGNRHDDEKTPKDPLPIPFAQRRKGLFEGGIHPSPHPKPDTVRDTAAPRPSAPGVKPVPKPSWVESPSPAPPHDLDEEPKSGVLHPKTGRTRELFLWLSLVTAIGTFLQPIINAVAELIHPSPANAWAREQKAREAKTEAHP